MQFNEIIGYDELKTKLIAGCTDNRLHHAHLFFDKSGGPSLALALAFATYINCENPTSTDSCGVCRACLKNKKLMHPDLHFSFPFYKNKEKKRENINDFISEFRTLLQTPFATTNDWVSMIDAENKQLKINVEECQSIVQQVVMRVFEGKQKIFLIWQPEKALTEINVLLKSLEEPPADTIFLLISYEPDLLLNTIISRCQTWRLRPLTVSEATQVATRAGHDFTPDMGLASEYNYGALLALLNDRPDAPMPHIEWLNACFKKNMQQAIGIVDTISKYNREQLKYFFVQAANEAYKRWQQCDIDKKEALFAIHKELETALYHTTRNANARMQLIDTSLRIKNIVQHLSNKQTSPTYLPL